MYLPPWGGAPQGEALGQKNKPSLPWWRQEGPGTYRPVNLVGGWMGRVPGSHHIRLFAMSPSLATTMAVFSVYLSGANLSSPSLDIYAESVKFCRIQSPRSRPVRAGAGGLRGPGGTPGGSEGPLRPERERAPREGAVLWPPGTELNKKFLILLSCALELNKISFFVVVQC